MDAYHDALKILQEETISRMEYLLDRANQSIVQLDDSQIWYRPDEKSNAIGNLVLHIVGSLKLMIRSGIAGEPNSRNRAAEFEAKTAITKNDLINMLNEMIESCCKAIAATPLERISEKASIQSSDMSIGRVLIMAVSHTSIHVGQMQYIAKMLLRDTYKESTNSVKNR
jgi:hypothetical protein